MRLILSAGMPRSGSTWLYNAVRLLINSSFGLKNNFSCGWIGDWNDIPKKDVMLIKIHDFDEQIVNNHIDSTDIIVYTYKKCDFFFCTIGETIPYKCFFSWNIYNIS